MSDIVKLSPAELHKCYIKNMNAFYRSAGGSSMAAEADEFMRSCAIGLWARTGSVSEGCAEAINEFYSPGQKKPAFLYWELTSTVCSGAEVEVPAFFKELAERDKSRGTNGAKIFIRVLTNMLMYIAALDSDVSMAEADFITELKEKLSRACAAEGKTGGIDPKDYVTQKPRSYLDELGDFADILNSAESAANQLVSETKLPETEEKADQAEEKPDLDQLMAELDSLVGLAKIKENVKSLINLMKVRRLREENGLTVPPMSLHLVFMGNPGTGKTTVARLIAQLYYAIGVLSKGQIVEVDRSGLVAGYVGQTAIKTGEVIKSAIGGVLFIDEAYSLANAGDSGNDFGREAIETLLKAMEDNRNDLVVIVAGYEDLMENFISSNPGLESRFNRYFIFEDYNGEELMQIFTGQCEKNQYVISEDGKEYAKKLFSDMYEQRDENFGNGRDVRNMFENAVSVQSDRVAQLENPSRDDLMTFTKEDLEKASVM